MATSQFQKMILVPEQASAQMISSVKSSESHQARLDQEMQDILQRTDLTTQEKWKLYQQALHRYLEHTPQAHKPIALPLIDTDPSMAPTSQSSPLFQFILDSVPKTLSRKTGVLLKLMHASNRISWDPTGVVTIDKNLVPGSNIIDLVNEVVRKRAPRNPIGIQTFKQLLQEINIPKELINFQFGAGIIKHRMKVKKLKRKPKKRSIFKNIFKHYREYKF